MKKIHSVMIAMFLVVGSIAFLPFGSAATTYAVVCGISTYVSKPLRYADDDAAAFYNWLLKVGVSKSNMTLLLNDQATANNVKAAVRQQFSKASSADVVIFYYSGHGANGVFATYGADQGGKALRHEELRDLFKQSEAAHKLCFADACFSGGLLPPDVADDFSTGDLVFQNASPDDFQGSVAIMMSSRANETSIERQVVKQGLFTYFLVKGLEGSADGDANSAVSISELFSYVSKNVVTNSEQKQHPVLTGKFPKNLVLSKYK